MAASAGPGEVLVRFPTHPHSVRTARQLVGDTLRAWDLEQLVDDARLIVSELTTNATLHSGERSFSLSVAAEATTGVRIAVGDEGAVPAAAVVRRARPAGGTATRPPPATTTGRGLGIVDELADDWGSALTGTRSGSGSSCPPAATAQDAAAEGREQVTIEMVLPSPAAEHVERLDEAVVAADALCERERLLTMASPPEVRALRAWMRGEICDQIRSGRLPRSYDEWRTATGRG